MDICEDVVKYVCMNTQNLFFFSFSLSSGGFIYKCGTPAWSTTALSPADLRKMWPERALFVFPHSVERWETHKSHSEKAALSQQ